MEKRKQEKETEELSIDIYDAKQREEMLKNDEITAAESAFMDGRELLFKKKKIDLWLEKKEAASVELAQKEYQKD